MPAGRPTLYNETIVPKVLEYIESCTDSFDKNNVKVKLPSIQGLSVYLNVNYDTVHEWRKVHPEFSDIIDKLLAIQADKLLNNGLAGTYNANIAKLILTKHGYSERLEQEIDHKGSLTINTISYKDNGDNNTPQV